GAARCSTLSLHDALPISGKNNKVSAWSLRALAALLAVALIGGCGQESNVPEKNHASSTSSPSARESPPRDAGKFFTWQEMHELRSEEHTSELQSRFDLVC